MTLGSAKRTALRASRRVTKAERDLTVDRLSLGDLEFPFLCVLVGMQIAFFVDLLGRSIMRGSAAGTELFRYEVVAYGLMLYGVLAKLLSTGGGQIWRRGRYRLWWGAYGCLLVIMVARSWLVGVGRIAVIWEMVPFLLVGAMFLGQYDAWWSWLNRTFIFQTVLAAGYGLYVLATSDFYFSNLSVARTLVRQETDLDIASKGLYAVPLLLFTYDRQSKVGRFAALVGVGIMTASVVFTQTRSTALEVLVVLGLAIYIWYRTRPAHVAWRRTLLILCPILAVFALGLGTGWGKTSGFQQSWGAFQRRVTGQSTVLEHSLDDYRFFEARRVVQYMTWDQWLIGSGVAGRWRYFDMYSGRTRTMVHIGYVHLLFKGGIFLTLLFLVFPVVMGWRVLLRHRDVWTLAAGAMLAEYSVHLLYGGAPNTGLWFILLFLCVGKAAVAQIKHADGDLNHRKSLS